MWEEWLPIIYFGAVGTVCLALASSLVYTVVLGILDARRKERERRTQQRADSPRGGAG